jgi:hypothetical protein
MKKEEEKINTMQDSLENIQQYQRKNNIIISGIPVSEQDVYDVAFQLVGVLNIELVYGDIDVAHRLPAKQGNRQTSILVKLLRHWKKEEIMNARYNKRRISTLDLGYNNLHQ